MNTCVCVVMGMSFVQGALSRDVPVLCDELLPLREYGGGMKTVRKTPRNTIVETQPSLLIRPLEADTLIRTAR
jgi:hypothetical protein